MNSLFFDFISPDITLFYNGKDKHSSFFSKILSLLILLLILYLIIYLSLDYILKRNPTSFTYNTYDDNIGMISFNSSGIFHYLYIYNLDLYFQKLDKKAFQIIGIQVNDENFARKNYSLIEFEHWIYSDCDENEKNELNSEDDIDDYLNYALCINEMYDYNLKKVFKKNEIGFIYPYLSNGTSKKDNNKYGIYIMKCQNYSYNNNSCYSDEEINQQFNDLASYKIIFKDNLVKITDYKKPFLSFMHEISNAFSKNDLTYNHLNFHLLQIKTHEGNIFDTETNINSFIFDLNEKLTSSKVDNIYGIFYFWIQNKKDIYDRTYKKIPDISGNINGIIELILLIAKFVNSFLFHEFRTLKDFNIELEKNLNIKKSKSIKSFNQNLISNSNNNYKGCNTKNSFILNINNAKKISKVSNLIGNNNNLIDSSNFYINLYESQFTQKMSMKFKQLSRYKYYLAFFHLKQNKYVNFLIKEREKIISEENIIKTYFTLKNLRKNVGIKNSIPHSFTNFNYNLKKILNDF